MASPPVNVYTGLTVTVPAGQSVNSVHVTIPSDIYAAWLANTSSGPFHFPSVVASITSVVDAGGGTQGWPFLRLNGTRWIRIDPSFPSQIANLGFDVPSLITFDLSSNYGPGGFDVTITGLTVQLRAPTPSVLVSLVGVLGVTQFGTTVAPANFGKVGAGKSRSRIIG